MPTESVCALRTDQRQRSATAPSAAPHRPRHNAFAGLLARDDILLDVDALTAERLFNRIASWLGPRYDLREHDIAAGFTARESLGSTALGQEVAIPMPDCPGLPTLSRRSCGCVRPSHSARRTATAAMGAVRASPCPQEIALDLEVKGKVAAATAPVRRPLMPALKPA